MKFIIEGTHAKSGQARHLEFEADVEQAAHLVAKDLGIFPYTVSIVPDEVPPSKNTRPGGKSGKAGTDRDCFNPERRKSNDTANAVIALGFLGLMGVVAFLFLCGGMFGPSTSPPAMPPIRESVESVRNRVIDEYVDQQVEKHWQPGGNSKEDAKKLTKDIMKTRNPKELQEALERNSREGR